MFYTFPEDARWNADRQAVEFAVEIGEYSGVVRVPRRVFQRLLPERPTPRSVSRLTISSGPGSRASPSESYAGGSCPRMGTWRSAGGICARSWEQTFTTLPRTAAVGPIADIRAGVEIETPATPEIRRISAEDSYLNARGKRQSQLRW